MDIRITRTKKLITDALLELMENKPVEKITPTELCRTATVNRNTFYSHYKSTAEVFEAVEDELLTAVDESINDGDSAVDAITALCKLMQNNKKLCTVLFSKNSNNKITQKAFDITDKFNMSKMEKEDNALSNDYRQMLSGFTIKGSAAALECWVQNGMTEPPENVAEFVYKISKYGSSSVTK